MRAILGSLLLIVVLFGCGSMKTTTEEDVIEKKDISTVSNYNGAKQTIQVVNIDLTKLYQLYPALQEKNVGLGFAESILDYLDETNRFAFTEEKSEIKFHVILKNE
jgi:hypothetical protein